MLSKRDLAFYLVAIKSFLRFYQKVGVVVHSDGTLDRESQALVVSHVPRCRVVAVAEADRRAAAVLDSESTLYKWRALDASYRRLVDTELASRSPARIIMDADIVIVNRPDEVIAWIESGGKPFLLGQPPCPPASSPAKPAPRHIQDVFKENLSPLSAALEVPASFLDGTTSGFYGCTDELSLDRIQRTLSACARLDIPMFEWGGEQCLVIYLLSLAGAVRLDPHQYFNFFPSRLGQIGRAKAVHFFGTYRFFKNAYPRVASQIVSQLVRFPKGQEAE